MFVPVSQTVLESDIQSLIMKACSEISSRQRSHAKAPHKDTPDIPQAVTADDMLLIEKNFDSLLSTIVLFIEQEAFSNVPMNLDVNF